MLRDVVFCLPRWRVGRNNWSSGSDYEYEVFMDIRLPKLGEGAESGIVVGIMVKEGDTITEGQTILELENEKAVAPIPSSVAGKVTSIKVKEGQKISVRQVLLSVANAASPAPAPASPAKKSTAEPEPLEAEPEEREAQSAPGEEPSAKESGMAPAASPSIRRLTRELGIDLKQIRGSERGGRIVLADIRAYIQRLQKLATATPSKSAPAVETKTPPAEPIDFSKWGSISKQAFSPLRKVISQRLTESWRTIPHVTQFDEADVTLLHELQKKYEPAYEEKGTRLTLTSFILKAVVVALKKHPIFNSSLDETTEEIIFKNYYHLGLAVDTEHGLLVPVLRDVDKKSMLELSKEIAQSAEKAKSRKTPLEEMQGGTFTLSNQGGIGGGQFTPIINKPQVAILGLGRGTLKAMVRQEKIQPRLMLPLGLSYDHRVIDGANAARFIVDLVAALQGFDEAQLKF